MLFDQADHSVMLTRQATCIGARAKNLVALPGFSGRVLAVLPDAVYLSGNDGEILWLCREGVPLHGRGITLPFPLPCFRSGEGFWVEGQSLKIGEDLAVELGRAVEWMPGPLISCEIGPLARVNDLVRQLLETIILMIGDEGSGRLILGLSSILKGEGEPTCSPYSWQLPILSPVFGLMTHCLEEGLSEIEARGRELVGLGPGLTPCGDDFLGGLFFTAHWLQEAFPGKLRLETSSIFNLMRWAKKRTHPISHAILGDLAIGQGPEPLHHLLLLLLKGGKLDGWITDAVDRLSRVGHTTGWWILAGVLTCVLSLDDKRRGRRAYGASWAEGESFYPHEAIVH